MAFKQRETPTTSVTTTAPDANLPTSFLEKMKEHAGEGVSTAAEDRIVPLIYILQAGSPQVKPRDPKYIEGAKPGDIWFRNSAQQEIVPGDQGFLFQPCYFNKCWNEWQPNRGGFVARHADDGTVDENKRAAPPTELGATKKNIQTDSGDLREAWVRDNGNILVHTREHAGFANGEPYVIAMSSTGHTVSRTWMDLMARFVIPGTSEMAPMFSRKYRFTTVDRSNNKNQSWSIFKIQDAGWVTEEEFQRGLAFRQLFVSGERQAAAPDAGGDDEGSAADHSKAREEV